MLSIRNISKAFPGVRALKGVSLEIEAGTCHALCGENGAGKSTLGKILGGLYRPDEGEILLDGAPVHFAGPQDAVKAGIAMIHQELLFCENMTVGENLCLGDLPAHGVVVDWGELRRRSVEYLASIGADIDPDQNLGTLPVSRQQLVQIAAGVGRGARVLVFDEPTSSLSQGETRRLIELIKDLLARGVTCIYVSHRLEEIFELCQTVTVLRDGELVGTVPVEGLTRDELVRMMIGRALERDMATPPPAAGTEEVLRVDAVSSPGKFRDVSFSLRRGEILGLAGLVGAGRTEVCEAIFGLDANAQGRVTVNSKERSLPYRVGDALRLGLGLVPEDRKRHGLVLLMNSRENVTLPTLDKVATATVVRSRDERSVAQKFFDRMRVKAPSIDSATAGLSGGNQQKLVIAKWLAADAEVLLVDEPTRGVDVGAKAEIHAMLRELAEQGKALVVVSSDLPELLALSTRILVMREGSLVGELAGGSDEESTMRLMAGV